MSQLAYIHSGSKTRIKKVKAGITMGTVGVPVIAPAANDNGCVLGTVTAGIDQVGMNLDTATYNTAQQSDISHPAQWVSVVTNADAVWQSRLSGSAATPGTALTAYFNTVASATGVLLTLSLTSGGATVDFSAVDDGVFFCYSGANAGHWRRGIPADGTVVNITQAFPYAIAVDDLFIMCPLMELAIPSATFSADLAEVDAEFATTVNTASYYRCVEVVLNDLGNSGLLNSYVNLIGCDHVLAGASLA